MAEHLKAMKESVRGICSVPTQKPRTSESTPGFSCLEGNGAKSLSLAACKWAVILHAEKANNCAVRRNFAISERVVQQWWLQREKIARCDAKCRDCCGLLKKQKYQGHTSKPEGP